jgi:hypothetical protein
VRILYSLCTGLIPAGNGAGEVANRRIGEAQLACRRSAAVLDGLDVAFGLGVVWAAIRAGRRLPSRLGGLLPAAIGCLILLRASRKLNSP